MIQREAGPTAPIDEHVAALRGVSAAQRQVGLGALAWAVQRCGVLPLQAGRALDALSGALGLGPRFASDVPATLAARLRELPAPARLLLLRAMMAVALLDGRPEREGLRRIEAAAVDLAVDEPLLVALRHIVHGRHVRLRLSLVPKVWFGGKLRRRIDAQGWVRAVGAFVWSTFFRRHRDDALAARYRALASLPAGSLGRAYLDYLHTNSFPLPGERGAISDLIIFHDLTHVISGYSTRPEDEARVAIFSAGFLRRHPFAHVLMALVQFHLGIRLTPAAAGEVGLVEPVAALTALLRGARLTEDILGDWDPWSQFPRPLGELRHELGA